MRVVPADTRLKPLQTAERSEMVAENQSKLPWSVADIAFQHIDHTQISDDEALFFVLASASLIESGSEVYTHLLNEHFAGDPALIDWLSTHWQHEELQHGLALRTYVNHAWPEFDWECAYRQFMAEYVLYCSLTQLEATPMLELAARCMVETGTASLYRSIHEYTTEPILKEVAGKIRTDEVRHYKNFYRYFVAHSKAASYSRWQVGNTLARRLAEIHSEDASCAMRHVFKVRYPDRNVDSADFHNINAAARALVINNMSRTMVVKMAIKPLALPASVQNYLVSPVAKVIQYVFSAS
jgi:hypothetical protein